jgi:uracil-DNA glycosylase
MPDRALFQHLERFAAPNVFNPWSELDPLDRTDDAARHRLRRLKQHLACRPAFVLVGEAAGYQGCRFWGVAFTSERLLLEDRIPRVLSPERITHRTRPWSEPSATVVWGCLHDLRIADRTVLWNAFPWHPCRPGEPHSNRWPSTAEVRQGAQVLRSVLDRFAGATVVAVGQVARRALQELVGGRPRVVRHPAMAGAREFHANLAAIVRNLSRRR